MLDLWLKRTLGLVLALLLFSMMALTLVDVLGRYFFATPVPGAFELTKLALGLVVFTALPMATLRAEHVTITILDHLTPAGLARFQVVLADLFSATVLAVLGWRIFMHGRQLAAYNETTTFLQIQFAPFVYGMSVMAVAAGLCCLILFARHASGGSAKPEEAP